MGSLRIVQLADRIPYSMRVAPYRMRAARSPGLYAAQAVRCTHAARSMIGLGRADMTVDVRIAFESGLIGTVVRCLKSAITGCEQLQQGSLYSITSSARASSVSVISKPSASAFFLKVPSLGWA